MQGTACDAVFCLQESKARLAGLCKLPHHDQQWQIALYILYLFEY